MSDGNDAAKSNLRENGSDGPAPPASIPVSYTESFDTLDYDVDTDSYRSSFDVTVDTPSLAVISAIAAVTGVAITELDPLHGVIDPDALDKLWLSSGTTERADSRVTFPFAGYDVSLSRDGLLSIRREGV
ncbi:HalOD1 output domain-containing protein [Halorientalis brevis]|uniref:HalOD1 output domain-containing protein n=1 Tax=Halorientalis brevis TaxID=1126241 RepID=A0ABD6CIK1_9EURY|nr:HalOD1 output domain-containing protein [Halorientalis brevis]